MPTPRVRTISVVAAKLYPGVGTEQALSRPKLDSPRELIDGSASVAVICAPAGYGKSTLMTRWHEKLGAAGVTSAWLSLDEDDNDPARFLRYLVAAFQTIHRDIGRDVLAQLMGAPTVGVKPLLESLASDLARIESRVVLFLDDLHAVTHPEVLEIVHWLINYSPRQFQYVLGSRSSLRVPLSGLRIRRKLLEVGARELEFSLDEAAQFLSNRLGGAMLLPAQIQQLLDKTEGWAAALELVAVALQDQRHRNELITSFTGTDRSVVEYLGEVVLSGLDRDIRDFVGRIAQFDRINPALAAKATGVTDAARLLEELHDRNLFLIPLDRNGEWYRFHQLVGHFFREHFRRLEPARCREIQIEGARWLFEHGHVEEAINGAIRAKAWSEAVEWMAQSVEELIYRHGYHQTLMHWMQELPDEWVDRFPAIRINYAFALAFYPRQAEVEAQLHRLENMVMRLEQAPRPDLEAINGIRCATELQVAISHGLRDDGIAARDSALAWMKRWPDAPAVQKGHVSNVLGFGYKSSSDIAEGLAVIAQGRRWHEQGEGHYGLAWNIYVEGLLHLKRGAYREARQVCLAGLELIERHLNGHRAHTSLLHTTLAAVAYQFDEADQAQTHIEQSMRSVQDYGPADAVILAYQTQARLRFLNRDPETAYAILHEGQELGARRELQRVIITLATEECTWLGRQERYEEAQEVAIRSGLLLPAGGDTASGLIVDRASRVALRINVRKSPEKVLSALELAIEHSSKRGLYHRWSELLGLKSVAHKLNGDWQQAMDSLNEALLIAGPRQYLRTFLDEGRELQAVMERMSAVEERYPETMPLVRRLLRSLNKTAQAVARGDSEKESPEATFGELTRRELNILKHLESGMSNKEIAESIFISEGTLRWHLHNIYGKLGAKNRSGALVKARASGLL